MLRFAEFGARASLDQVLVLLHAFPLHAGMWAGIREALPTGWRLIAPDLRGFGASRDLGETRAEADLALDDYAVDVEQLLAGLGIERAVIGGLSMGGYVTLALFRRSPGRFRAMILADTRPQADSDEARQQRWRLAELARREGAGPVVDELLPKLLAPASRGQPVEDAVRAMAAENAREGIANALIRMMRRPDSSELLPRIPCPVLLLAGAEDTLAPPDVMRAMHDQIPGSELVVIDGAGHLSNLERPERFNAVVAGFLGGLAQRV